ncbi:MAG: hypothetical protein QGI10_09035 [Vicinamibacterales bacterium]|jgi:hypothetical protein|nr:hypothetical protein [Vicinamibacterales bacterium]HJN47070.1 hypothetical protein [Vicinamibacterales bacterium]
MTRQTRYFVLGMSGLLVVGLCTGLFAYFNNGEALALSVAEPVEFAHVPPNASIVAYANVREVMLSDFRERIRQIAPDGVGQAELEQQLGLNIENDIDHVLAFLAPGRNERPAGLVLFRGRFDTTRLEAVARNGGATVSDYADTRVVSIDAGDAGALAMAFMEPGLVAVGDLATVHQAVDRGSTGVDITSNEQMMGLLEQVDSGSNAWAVGRFGDLSALGILPDEVSVQMPAVTAFVVDGRVNGGFSGSVTIEGRDEQAGQNLRDVLRGFLALAKMQTTGRPELQLMLDSLQLSGTGTIATMSFLIPSEALDLIFSYATPDTAP